MSRGPTGAATPWSCRLSPHWQPATALGLPPWSIVQRGMEHSDRCRFFLSSPGLRQPIGKKKTIFFDLPLASFSSISSSSPQPAFAYFILGPFQGTENRHAERTQKPRPGGIAQALEKARSRFVAVDSSIEARWEACPARRGPMQAGGDAAPSRPLDPAPPRRLAQAPARQRFSLPWPAGWRVWWPAAPSRQSPAPPRP